MFQNPSQITFGDNNDLLNWRAQESFNILITTHELVSYLRMENVFRHSSYIYGNYFIVSPLK